MRPLIRKSHNKKRQISLLKSDLSLGWEGENKLTLKTILKKKQTP